MPMIVKAPPATKAPELSPSADAMANTTPIAGDQLIGRMPPKRTSTLRVRYINQGRGKPRAYRLDE